MTLDYEKVQEKYEDSLSQYDLHGELTDVNKFGPINFSEIEAVFQEMVAAIYELEVYDYKSKLFDAEIGHVDETRNFLNQKFQAIHDFDIGQDQAPSRKEQINQEVKKHYRSQFYKIDDILTKIRSKKLLDDSKGKEIEGILAASKQQLEEGTRAKEQINKIKEELEKTLEEAKRGTQEAGTLKSQKGSLEIGQFFEKQADQHREKADGKISKTKWDRFQMFVFSWIGKRAIFFTLILLEIVGNIILFFLKKETFELEYGILSLSLLLIFYMGMSFATNNYSVEKQLEIENKNKSNIANTLELFLAAPQTETSRSIILQEATRTLFAQSKTGHEKGKVQNVNLPITEITKILKDTSSPVN